MDVVNNTAQELNQHNLNQHVGPIKTEPEMPVRLCLRFSPSTFDGQASNIDLLEAIAAI